MRISDWSSDVCSSDLDQLQGARAQSRQDALAAGRGQARGGGGDRRLEEAGTRRKAGSPAVGRGYFPACGRGDSARPCVTAAATSAQQTTDRKSVVSGKSVSVRVDLGGSRIIKKTKKIHQQLR